MMSHVLQNEVTRLAVLGVIFKAFLAIPGLELAAGVTKKIHSLTLVQGQRLPMYPSTEVVDQSSAWWAVIVST